jgi:glycosyltransferase involved in cell wall biosynthesis
VRVTVAIPCFNEAATIGKVVRDFRTQLPEAEIIVFDNASSDGSAERAREAGARVVREKRRGKGFVMQAILETVDCDACVIVDGDDTYFAEDARALLEPVASDSADMVVGSRLQRASSAALTDLHRFGNQVILRIVNTVFRTSFADVLSGFRVVNRNFMRSVPLITPGFETEAEITLQALERGMVIREVPIRYRARPAGSFSKLSPFADGYRIVITIGTLLKNHRPLFFFSCLGAAVLLSVAGLSLVWLAQRPAALQGTGFWVLVTGGALLSSLFVLFGLLMSAVTTGFSEMISLGRRPRREEESVPVARGERDRSA